jgi:hypothetical protein
MRYGRPAHPQWAAFAELVERNNGIYGGCWCMAYHPEVSRTDLPVPKQRPDLLDAAGPASSAYLADGRASMAPSSVQNDHFRVPSAGTAGSEPAAPIGGYARGPSLVAVTVRGGVVDLRRE